MITTMVETVDAEVTHSERMFWTYSDIDSIFLWLLENCVKAEGNASLGESERVEEVLGVELEEYELVASGWENGLVV